MPIQILLTLGLLAILLYVSVQKVMPRAMTAAFAFLVVGGVYFVWMPSHTTVVARWLGVGRGTDLLIYVWILLTLFMGVNLHLKIRSARAEITGLARAIALVSARGPAAPSTPEDGAPMSEPSE